MALFYPPTPQPSVLNVPIPEGFVRPFKAALPHSDKKEAWRPSMEECSMPYSRALPLGIKRRLGATVEPFLVRTPGEVEQVWPSAETILPTSVIEELPLEKQRVLLGAFSRNRILAYRCLRWARWMTPNRHLVVTCVRCQCAPAWSESVVSQRKADGKFWPDDGKWRWVCPTPTQRFDPSGCGRRFYDTSETPFCHTRLPPGLLFAALAYPSGVIQRLLQKGQRSTDWRRLYILQRDVASMADRRLLGRLTQYARLFCGTVLLQDCSELTSSFDGVEALEARLRSLHRSGPAPEQYDAAIVRQRQASYAELRRLVNTLQDVDKHSVSGQTEQPHIRRGELWQELQRAVQTLRDPIHPIEPAPIGLQALLAEASLPDP